MAIPVLPVLPVVPDGVLSLGGVSTVPGLPAGHGVSRGDTYREGGGGGG